MPKKSSNKDIPNVKESQEVMEEFAYLIEDVFEKSSIVSAAQSIVDKIQKMAEDLAMMEAKDIMPMTDSLTTAFGPELAKQFSDVATTQVRNLVVSVQNAKTAIDQEIMRMKQGVEGGDTSDMGMMGNEAPPMGDEMGMGDEMAADGPETNLPETPPEDMDAGVDDNMNTAPNFAGREKKESAAPKGKRLKEESAVSEDFLDAATPTKTPSAAHKSPHFDDNLDNIKSFHGKAGECAHEIASLIHSGSLTAKEQKSLANVLSHFCYTCHDPAHWGIDTEAKLNASLRANGLYEINKPAVVQVVDKLRELVGIVTQAHRSMMESAIVSLRNASDPDALILKTFRGKLRETRDAQTAAINTARSFAIDVDDVVSIIREAATKKAECKTCKGTGKVDKFADMENGPKVNCPKCKGTGKVKESVSIDKKKVSETSRVEQLDKNADTLYKHADKPGQDKKRATTGAKLAASHMKAADGKGKVKESSSEGALKVMFNRGKKCAEGGGKISSCPQTLEDDLEAEWKKGFNSVKKTVTERDMKSFADNKLGAGRYTVSYTDSKNKKHSDKFETKKAAETFRDSLDGCKNVSISESVVNEFKMDTPDSAKGMFKGVTTGELEKKLTATKKKIEAKGEKGHAELSKLLKRIEFAIRAHKSKNGGGWHKKVNEEELLQNVPMYPIGATSATSTVPKEPAETLQTPGADGMPQQNQQQPTQAPVKPVAPTPQRSAAPIGGPNNNTSTIKSQDAGEKRFAQNQQQQTQNQGTDTQSAAWKALNMKVATGNQAANVPPQQGQAPAPNGQPQQNGNQNNMNAQKPTFPGKVVNR